MIPKLVDVLVHIDEELDADSRDGLDGQLRSMQGIYSVSMPQRRPHLMMVEYDPDFANAAAILGSVTRRGLHAELVGL